MCISSLHSMYCVIDEKQPRNLIPNQLSKASANQTNLGEETHSLELSPRQAFG